MKLLLILLVLLGLAYYFFVYRKADDAPKTAAVGEPAEAVAPESAPPPAPTADPRSFDNILTLLRQDMNGIPATLDGPGHPPANAVAIRRRVRPYLSTHTEYQVITQACDLIINADTQRATFQAACHAEQGRAAFNNSLTTDISIHTHRASGQATPTPTPSTEDAQQAIHQRIETSWNNYRAETAAQVQQLLVSLAGKRL